MRVIVLVQLIVRVAAGSDFYTAVDLQVIDQMFRIEMLVEQVVIPKCNSRSKILSLKPHDYFTIMRLYLYIKEQIC